MALRGKDLWACLNDVQYMTDICAAAADEIDLKNSKAAGSDNLIQSHKPPPTTGDGAASAPKKPRTVSEHRKERAEEPSKLKGVGSLFERPRHHDKLELQYVFFFVLAESDRLRREVADASPKRIQEIYLPYLKDYFYRHLSGISEKRTASDGCPFSSQGSTSVQIWVANELLRISMLYNIG